MFGFVRGWGQRGGCFLNNGSSIPEESLWGERGRER